MSESLDDVLAEDARIAVVGAVAGVAATALMSVLMVAAQRTGVMSELPPHAITRKTLDRTDGGDEVDPGERRQLGWLAHFAFGAVAGALYGPARRHVRTPGPSGLHGAGYGLAIWTVSYLGWVPGLRFLPSAPDDEPGRPPVMIAAHLLFGAVLGIVVDRSLRR